MKRAALLAEQQLRERGGVGGRPLRLVFMDDSGTENFAVRVAKQLTDSGRVVAVVGHLSSGPTRVALGVYANARRPVPVISPSASNPDLSGISPWFFRICPSDLAHGAQLARFARQRLGAARAAVIYTNDDYGRGVRRTFVAEFTRLGGTILEEDPFLATHASAEPYLARIRRRGGVDVLMLATQRPEAETVLRDLRGQGLRWPVMGGDALVGIEADGPLAEGVRVSVTYLADRVGDQNAAFVAEYARSSGGARPDHRGAGAYDILMLLARAVEQGGGSPEAIRDYLATVGSGRPAYEGVTGRIAFDAHGDVPDKPITIAVVRGGRLVTEWAP
jgi:branched-chain amino acid transport system substrate-binding protein